MTLRNRIAAVLIVMLVTGAGCQWAGDPPSPGFVLMDADFRDLPGWADDDHDAALGVFLESCALIGHETARRPVHAGPAVYWQERCRLARGVPAGGARSFFESWFLPWRLQDGRGSPGLFTGYYEPLLAGSRTRDATYRWPLYRPPAGLEEIPERAAIDAGALEGMDLEILWIDDPVDVFFLHVQGSGRVRLEDGHEVRVGYAGRNGLPYHSIGRELADRGEIPIEEVSMATIRAWLAAHPGRAPGIMATNRSYVFFRELEGDGPVGAQGVVLTPGRSLAVDDAIIAYGAPVWLATTLPDGTPWRRLMIAQDTGSAIAGAVRGDIFFGGGAWAESMAGGMKAPGQSWLLLPHRISGSLVAWNEP